MSIKIDSVFQEKRASSFYVGLRKVRVLGFNVSKGVIALGFKEDFKPL